MPTDGRDGRPEHPGRLWYPANWSTTPTDGRPWTILFTVVEVGVVGPQRATVRPDHSAPIPPSLLLPSVVLVGSVHPPGMFSSWTATRVPRLGPSVVGVGQPTGRRGRDHPHGRPPRPTDRPSVPSSTNWFVPPSRPYCLDQLVHRPVAGAPTMLPPLPPYRDQLVGVIVPPSRPPPSPPSRPTGPSHHSNPPSRPHRPKLTNWFTPPACPSVPKGVSQLVDNPPAGRPPTAPPCQPSQLVHPLKPAVPSAPCQPTGS